METLSVIYQPKFKACDFVVRGIDLPEVKVIALNHRQDGFSYAMYGVFLFLRLYALAFFFRYTKETRLQLKAASGDLLFWDSCSFKDYRMMNAFYGKKRRKNVFFWNPLTRWNPEPSYIRHELQILEKSNFRFFTFDTADAKRYEIAHVRNVNRMMNCSAPDQSRQDFYFVGSAKSRRETIVNLEARLKSMGYSTKFLLIENKSDYISNEENIRFSGESACIVDIVSQGQAGLTLRPFDALFLKRKLLTNCKLVSTMDFYNPANIFIMDGPELEGLDEFMRRPYQEIDAQIVYRYEVNQWIRDNFLK